MRQYFRLPLLSTLLSFAVLLPVSATAAPSAGVTTAAAHSGSLSETVLSYGTLAAAPTGSRNVIVQYDAIVEEVMVHAGQYIAQGTPLARITTTPAAAAQYAQARSAYDLARSEFQRQTRLNKAGLSSNDQLATARKSLNDAFAQLKAQKKAGASTGLTLLKAPVGGVVTSLSAAQGDQLTAGSVVASVSSRKGLVARLGLEPEDATRLSPGDKATLSMPLDGNRKMQATLRSVGGMIDPQSRLVPAIATFDNPPENLPVIGTTMVAHLSLPPREGILVPRSAILEDGEGTYTYTVENGKAARHNVNILAETDTTSLIGKGIAPDATVIVSGNAALEDGIAVHEVSK